MFSMIGDDKQRSELEAFYKENQELFLNAAYSNLRNRSEAEDAVQEAFRAIVKAPDNFFDKVPEKRIGYMIGVIKFISVDMIKKKNKRSFESIDDEEAYDNPLSFEDSVIGIVSKDELDRFIESLPDRQRDVLKLRCFMGYSTAETAKKLHITQTAVKKRLRLAKEAVREYIGKGNETHE